MFKIKYKSTKNGFTLVEMVIVLAIIGALLGIGWARWAVIKDQDEIEGAAEAIQTQIAELKQKSSAPRPTPVGALPADVLQYESNIRGYGMVIDVDDGRKYTIFTDKAGVGVVGNYDSADDIEQKTYLLSELSIKQARISSIVIDNGAVLPAIITGNYAIVFSTNEIPSQRHIYFDGSTDYDGSQIRTITINMTLGSDFAKRIVLDAMSGEVHIES